LFILSFLICTFFLCDTFPHLFSPWNQSFSRIFSFFLMFKTCFALSSR
jgi:hypothetical protein